MIAKRMMFKEWRCRLFGCREDLTRGNPCLFQFYVTAENHGQAMREAKLYFAYPKKPYVIEVVHYRTVIFSKQSGVEGVEPGLDES
jgi:hypothetical protein